MKKLLILLLFVGLFFCTSCAPKQHITGVISYVKKDGEIGFKERQFRNLSQCQRKSKRIARRRGRVRDHNPNYGITVMGGARQRR